MDLFNELIAVAAVFNDNGIEYALCGGMAVAFHGYPRFTGDIDFLLIREHLSRAKEILKKLGYTIAAGPFPFDVNSPHPREVHRISKIEENDTSTIDILIINEPLEEVWKTREKYSIEGHLVYVVSREGLIKMKTLAGRDQDMLDIKKLSESPDGDER